jgi:uncharacterized protein (TIGR00730 family)
MFRIIGELVEGFDLLSNIAPAVSVYGSARIKPEDELYQKTEEIARQLGEMGFSIITGGGPGVMEAANKGARKAGVKSIGLNINLPEEQTGNIYTTQSQTFHHFFVRKVMLVKYASAFIIIPGGLGTLDELTEVLTLMQTYKIKPFPVVLFDGNYWKGFLDWLRNFSLAKGYISEQDLNLLRVCDNPDEVIETIHRWYYKRELAGRQAVTR